MYINCRYLCMLIFNLWILMLINEYIHLSVNVYSQMINITSNSIKGFECSNHPKLYFFCIDVEIPWSCKESSKADSHVKGVHAGLDLYHWLKSKKFRGIATLAQHSHGSRIHKRFISISRGSRLQQGIASSFDL